MHSEPHSFMTGQVVKMYNNIIAMLLKYNRTQHQGFMYNTSII